MDDLSTDREVDSKVSAKASGFIIQLESFEFYFLLTVLIAIFDRIEILNAELQKSDISFNECNRKIQSVMESLAEVRESKFETVWLEAVSSAKDLGLEEPKLPRKRKIPKRLETDLGYASSSQAYSFLNPKIYCKKIYCVIFDHVLMAMNTRFKSETLEMMSSFESFGVGNNGSCVKVITVFYNSRIVESGIQPFPTLILMNKS